MTDSQTPESTVEIITPEEARQHLEAAMAPYIEDGWEVLVEHDYMASLNKGRRNLDIHVDLLGEVSMEEKGMSASQHKDLLILIVLIIGGTLVTIALASALGYF